MPRWGIGNTEPRGILEVNDNPDGNATAGLVLPHTNNPAQLINPQTGEVSEIPGTIAYDSQADCIKFIKMDETWSDCIEEGDPPEAGSIASLDCSGATNNGTLTPRTAANGVTSVISYTGSNGGAHRRANV